MQALIAADAQLDLAAAVDAEAAVQPIEVRGRYCCSTHMLLQGVTKIARGWLFVLYCLCTK